MPINSSERVLQALESEMLETKINSKNDNDFIRRVYNGGDLEKYRRRITSIGFSSLESTILDAGCGYGQWSIALSERNDYVVGIDADPNRINISRNISNRLGINNINYINAPLNCNMFDDQHFGAIFCFNSIMLSAWKETLSGFYRVLSKGGLLYFNAVLLINSM